MGYDLANTSQFIILYYQGLVRAAQSCALNRLVKASSKVEVDVNAAEKLMIGDNDDDNHDNDDDDDLCRVG